VNAESIVLDLYRSGEIRKACLTITGGNPLWKDLEQEVVLILLEKDPDKITKMQVAKKYRHHDERVEVDPETQELSKDYDSLLDDLWAIAQSEMDSWAKDGAFPYDKELLNLLMQTGNMKAMSRETGIPYRSIIYSIEQAKAKIKTAIESNGYTGFSNPD
jgi:hypothetical protein